MYDYKQWRHVYKLDPNKDISDENLESICRSGTDAVMIGGTDGITLENVLQLLIRVRKFKVPCALEVSTMDSIIPGFDLYFIPTVLNSRDSKWIVGIHQLAMREYGNLMDFNELVAEGYCIVNEDSTVAKATNANCDLTKEDIVSYAQVADKLYHLPIFYLEYSGTYGDIEIVKQVSDVIDEARFFYGGGITNEVQAREMARYADTIIVGNAIYTDLEEALKTVQAVKGA